MPDVGILLEVPSAIQTRYLALNTEIDYLVPNNSHIKEVYPSQNDLIPVGTGTNKINITFLNPIDPTTGANISIYQHYNENTIILRQNLLCTNPFCVIENESYSLTINLLNTTF